MTHTGGAPSASGFSPNSPDDALIFRNGRRDSDIAISSLSGIAGGGDGEPGG